MHTYHTTRAFNAVSPWFRHAAKARIGLAYRSSSGPTHWSTTGSIRSVQNYPWRQISNDSYTQEYDSWQSVQAMWNTVDEEQRRLNLLTSYIKIDTNIENIESRLRGAWTGVRCYHPGIAIELGEHVKTYTVPTRRQAESWCRDTFIVPECDTAEEFQRGRLSTNPQAQLYWFPKARELLLIGHHALFDAKGAWLFWQSFLELVVSPKPVCFGDEWNHLPPVRDDLLSLPKHPTLAGNAKGLAVLVDALEENAIELPTLNQNHTDKGSPRKSRNGFLRVALPTEQSAAIVRSCKLGRVTLTAAFFAALCIVCRKIQSEFGHAGRYAVGFHNFDCRSWFPIEARLDCNVGNDPHAMIPFALDLEGKKFHEIVAEADARFKSIRDEFGRDPTGLDAVSHMLKGMLSLDGPIATFPGFSSFGVGERLIKPVYHEHAGKEWVKIEDTYQWIHNMLRGMNAVCLYSWGGRIQLGACFNEAYHSHEMFLRVIQDTCNLLLEECGVTPASCNVDLES